MSGEIKPTTNHQFPQQYLDEITEYQLKPMDSKEYRGNGDGKVSIWEALNKFSESVRFLKNDGYFQSKEAEKNFDTAAAKLPEALAKYAGDDKEFSAQEMAEFINSPEWNDIIKARPFNLPWLIGNLFN